MKTKLLILITLFTMPFCSNAQTVDQSHTGSTNGNNSISVYRYLAQSFTAGLTGSLTEISIDFKKDACSEPITSFTMTFDIIDGDGYSGTVLATETISVSIPYARNMLTVSFGTPPNVVNGQTYTIKASSDSNDICDVGGFMGDQVVFGRWYVNGAGDTYTNGISYEGGNPWLPGYDFYFTTTVDTTLGLDQFSLTENYLSVYPNPTKQDINVALQDNNISSIRVIDLLGKVVYSENNINTPEYKLTLNQNPGLYILVITDDNGITVNKKILKE